MNQDGKNAAVVVPVVGRLKSALETLATLAVIVTCCIIVWQTLRPRAVAVGAAAGRAVQPSRPAGSSTPQLVPAQPVSLDGAILRGNRSARVALIVYSDFQCPFCGEFARNTLPAIEQNYVASDKVLLAFREFPLEALHPFAIKAAEGAECAGRQGKFWQFHDLLFQDQKNLSESSLRERAKTVGLTSSLFDACLDGQATAKVRQDIEAASGLGVRSTPTSFLGTVQPDGRVRVAQRFSGALPFPTFRTQMEALLKASEIDGAKETKGQKHEHE